MRKIPAGKKYAFVDDRDYQHVKHYRWTLSPTGYAMARLGGSPVYMHRLILNIPTGLEAHHKDRNPLNNQRANLCICTHGQNMAARVKHKDNKAGFKGVAFCRGMKKPWGAQICKDGRIYRLGNFATKEEAARQYDKIAKDLYGDFAGVNFPDES